MLPFVLEHGVALTGEVRDPGVYPVVSGTRISSLISAANGLARDTVGVRGEILRVVGSGDAQTRQRHPHAIDLADRNAAQIPVEPADVIRFSARFNDRERGPVRLSGEVVHPGIYTVRKGESLSQLVRRAGGLTDQAYPYGSIFTRERVRLVEEQALRRVAREINSALTVAAARKDVEMTELAALSRLTEQLRSAEAIGRVVIEADPTVLQVRPELDTVLESGDRLFVPKRPNYVTVSGNVLNPSSLQFNSRRTVTDYIGLVGGFQTAADESRVFVVFPNGEAKSAGVSAWNLEGIKVAPGSTIVVPRDVAPFDLLEFAKDVAPILSSLAVTAASLAILANN